MDTQPLAKKFFHLDDERPVARKVESRERVCDGFQTPCEGAGVIRLWYRYFSNGESILPEGIECLRLLNADGSQFRVGPRYFAVTIEMRPVFLLNERSVLKLSLMTWYFLPPTRVCQLAPL